MLTLQEMKVGMTDKVAQQIIDTFLRNSEILQLLPFDNCVSPQGGSTLTYSYVQKKLPALASFRTIGREYTSSEATLERKSVDLKIFGGQFELDRVIKKAESRYNNMAFQLDEHILAAISLFHHTLINGDSTTNVEEFDGLDKLLAGTSTEFGTAKAIDLSTIDKIKANADEFYEALNKLMKSTKCDALLMNNNTIGKIQTVARILGYKTESEEAFGKKVSHIDGIRLMELGNHYTINANVPVANSCVKEGLSRTVGSESLTGLTDIYAIKFDINDGFHGASLSGNGLLDHYLPDFNQPGPVKRGEVEMVAATVLKNTAHAGVLRNIKIA